MTPIYTFNEAQLQQLYRLYQQEWWTGERSLEDTRRVVSGSQITIGLLDDDELVGFTRVLTDFTFKALIFDVIVSASHRDKGLGSRLIQLVKTHPELQQVRHFELYCLPELEPFYQRQGFSDDVAGTRLLRWVKI